jgi:hypothetical protein
MKISELPNCPAWLKEAHTKDASVEACSWDANGVIWRYGVWLDGEWRGGVWHGGEWRGGVWHGGVWCGGEWRYGEWLGGEWLDGVWLDGEWRGGVWLGGAWHGGEWQHPDIPDRLIFMASHLGIVFGKKGFATAYRSTQADGHGRHTSGFIQKSGKYLDPVAKPVGAGTCVKGIHVADIATAYTYFGIDPTAQLWEVKFKREDLLDCDFQKARIRGGTFKKIEWPWGKVIRKTLDKLEDLK